MKFTLDEYCFIHACVKKTADEVEELYQLLDMRDKRNGVKKMPDDTRKILSHRNRAQSILKKLDEEAL